MEKTEQNWEKSGMEETSEEEESSLVYVRKSRNGNGTLTAVDDGGDLGYNGHANNGAENEQKVTEVEELDGVLEVEEEPINGEHEKENLVFFDKAQGKWKCRICPWTYGDGSFCVDLILNHKGLLHKPLNFKTLNFECEGVDSTTSTDSGESQIVDNLLDDLVVQNNSTTGINNKHEGNVENIKSSNEIESAEANLINDEEDDLEVAEIDVERVIKIQNTHDLYCPNCNSCITRRVILTKRKRSIRTSDDEVKRNKTETAAESALGKGSIGSRGEKARHTVDDDDDARIPTVDEEGRERVPDVFRCLSCFSFFIPRGDGFKLFKLFGDKSGIEKIQDEQAPQNVKKNWFASMFASKKQETTVEQGSSFQTDVGKSDVLDILSSNLGGQSGQSPFSQNAPSPPPNKQNTSSNENLINGFRDMFDMTKIETADATMDHFESYTEDLKESKSSKEVPVSSEDYSSVTALSMSSQVTNVGSSEDAISSFSHQDGLKLLISSNNGSLTLGNSKEGRMTNQTVQSEYADKDAIPLSTPVPELKASNVDGNWNFSVSIPNEQEDVTATILTESFVENKNMNAGFSSLDTGHIHPIETSEHKITKTKFEVHSGKDTVITIDSQPEVLSHTLEGVTGLTETSNLLQQSTHRNIAGRVRIEVREEYGIEVIKSIVYGGLAELITSLSVVSSAAGGGAATLNILALGAANLIGGLFIIFHNLWELRCDRVEEQVNNQISDQVTDQRDRYKELLGKRKNFLLHAVVAIISYLVFGLMPPVVYGFSFRKTDDKQLKLLAVAAASLLCLVALALGRAHVQRCPRPYFTSVATFVILGYMGSGVSYAAGKLIERLLEKLRIFQASSVSGLGVNEMMASAGLGWASH